MHEYPEGLPFEVKKPEQWELEHDIYFPLFKEAQQHEKEGRYFEALELYRCIHQRFTPRGSSYYVAPLWLLERDEHFDETISLCQKAITAIGHNLFKGDTEIFRGTINRVEKKKNQSKDFNSYQDFAVYTVVSFISMNPNLNKITLLSRLHTECEIFDANKYVEEAVKQGIIIREKRGRAFIYHV